MNECRSGPGVEGGQRRLLVVAPSSRLGGSQTALAGLIRLLPDHGWEPVVMLLEPGPLQDWVTDAGCEVHTLAPHRTRNLLQTFFTIKRLAAQIRSSGAAVVLSNESKGHIFGGLAALVARRPAVFWQHGVPKPSKLERIAAKVPARAILVGSAFSGRAQRELSGSTPVVKIACGIDVAAIAARSGAGSLLRASLRWSAEDPVVGIVGRLQTWKGQRIFLEAARLLARSHPRVRFLVVGGSSSEDRGYEAELREIARTDEAFAGRVHFSGAVAVEDAHDWMDVIDVVTHCSFEEPFGIVILEAMALGKPLVAAASGGPLEIVKEGVSGLLVPPGDPKVLAAAVSRLLDNPELAAKLSAGGRLHVRAFDTQRHATEVACLLDRVAALELPAKSRLAARPGSKRHRHSQLLPHDAVTRPPVQP